MNPPEENLSYIDLEPVKEDSIQAMNRYQVSSGDLAGGGNLDKVRDILFGTQMRDYEKRFTRMEERLMKECTNLRDDTRKRLDSLETYIKQEIESLGETVKKQQSTQDEALKDIAQELKNQTSSLEQKVSHLDEQTNKSAKDLRQQILEQSKNLDDEIRQKFSEMLAVIERETKELRTDKANRTTLSALFAEMAMRLRSEQ